MLNKTQVLIISIITTTYTVPSHSKGGVKAAFNIASGAKSGSYASKGTKSISFTGSGRQSISSLPTFKSAPSAKAQTTVKNNTGNKNVLRKKLKKKKLTAQSKVLASKSAKKFEKWELNKINYTFNNKYKTTAKASKGRTERPTNKAEKQLEKDLFSDPHALDKTHKKSSYQQKPVKSNSKGKTFSFGSHLKSDPRFSKSWEKRSRKIETAEGYAEVHYQYNKLTGALADIKYIKLAKPKKKDNNKK